MKRIICLIILLIAGWSGYGQTVAFKGQVVNNSNAVVKNYTVIIDGKPTTTNDSGEFSTAISNTTYQMNVKTSDKNYVITYPPGGTILVPKDASLLTQIVVEPFQSSAQLKSYLVAIAQSNDAAKKGQAETQALKVKIDTLTAYLQRIGYTNDDLRMARERQDGIDLFFPQISHALQEYILQAQALMKALNFIGVFAFVDLTALTQYAPTQNGFNAAYQNLYDNYPTYSKKISDYWSDEALTTEFGAIADTLLYSVGRNRIVPLNEVKDQINQYYKLPRRDQSKAKQDIQARLANQIPPISMQLDSMELRVKKFLEKLKN